MASLMLTFIINTMDRLIMSDASEQVSEIKHLATGKVIPFSSLIDSDSGERETYYAAAPLAFIVRVLRSEKLHAGARPALVQFYDFGGGKLGEWTRYVESVGAFCTIFSQDVSDGKLFKLSRKPSFIPAHNVTSFSQIIPRSRMSSTGILGIISDPPNADTVCLEQERTSPQSKKMRTRLCRQQLKHADIA
jgi:hypothetical protein